MFINKYKSPLIPPLVPASPFPASLILVPSSTPFGIVTEIFFEVCLFPCPLQSVQGLVISSPQPAHNSPPPLTYYSIWLSMNILVLDPKTVCVEKSELYQAEQLDKLGMEVIPIDLRDAYAFGGGLHCCTADVYREGKLEDYFPKQ